LSESGVVARRAAREFASGDIDQAIEMWNEALAMRIAIRGEHDKCLIDVYGSLAVAHFSLYSKYQTEDAEKATSAITAAEGYRTKMAVLSRIAS